MNTDPEEKVIHPDLERLAELCHEQWSGWMEYMFSKCDGTALPGYRVIPEWAEKRWTRQLLTPYAELSEEEKDSDRKEAQRFIDLLNKPL